MSEIKKIHNYKNYTADIPDVMTSSPWTLTKTCGCQYDQIYCDFQLCSYYSSAEAAAMLVLVTYDEWDAVVQRFYVIYVNKRLYLFK